jgi:hypothetical protein
VRRSEEDDQTGRRRAEELDLVLSSDWSILFLTQPASHFALSRARGPPCEVQPALRHFQRMPCVVDPSASVEPRCEGRRRPEDRHRTARAVALSSLLPTTQPLPIESYGNVAQDGSNYINVQLFRHHPRGRVPTCPDRYSRTMSQSYSLLLMRYPTLASTGVHSYALSLSPPSSSTPLSRYDEARVRIDVACTSLFDPCLWASSPLFPVCTLTATGQPSTSSAESDMSVSSA